jgi:D-sedoheptulose 7-phosphate isomerase
VTVQDYFAGLAECAAGVEAGELAKAVSWIQEVKRVGGTVHLVGNGGSAAIVAHAQNDFVKAAKVKAQVHQDIPLFTACANDCGWVQGAAMPLSLWIDDDDLLIAVSSSGESRNIHTAVEVARRAAASVITFTGFDAHNTLRKLGDLNFYAPSLDYGHVELTHAALLHYLTDEVARA